jgi:hypothetical protein
MIGPASSSRAVAGQQVVQAVALLAYENGHPRLDVAEEDARDHAVALREKFVHDLLDVLARDEEALEFPFDTHEKVAVDGVHILVEIDDVAVVAGDESRHVGDDALPVRTMQQDDGFAFRHDT